MLKGRINLMLETMKRSVDDGNVVGIIQMGSEFKLDNRQCNPFYEYAKALMIEEITKKVNKNRYKKYKVRRNAEYGMTTTDTCAIKDGKLMRNGTDVKYTNYGKLYTAYQQIKGKETKNKQ